MVVKVAAPTPEEAGRLKSDGVLIGFLQPLTNGDGIRAIAGTGVTSFALEAVPRISRAQSMDALSSQANIAGYKGVLIAATEIGRYFPMLMTAAGTIRPATVLVLGAGVAGLQAIATARRLGAVVQGFDVRAAVKEQVESLGAKFLEFDLGGDLEGAGGYAKELTAEQQARQQELMAEAIGKVDVVITTAAVPGRRAPILVTEAGGQADEAGLGDHRPRRRDRRQLRADRAGRDRDRATTSRSSAPLNVPSTMAEHASQLYARNIEALLGLMISEEGELEPRLRRRGHRRGVHHPGRRDRPRGRQGGRRRRDRSSPGRTRLSTVTEIAILVLAGFVGFAVISKVPNTLHTPLMSGTNAIHGIVLLGGLLLMSRVERRAREGPARDRGRVRHDQRDRRVLRHRPDARDVQAQGSADPDERGSEARAE